MSRPGSYHDGSQLASSDSFSLPLFNPHQTSGGPPSIPLPNRSSTMHELPPPPSSATHHLHRHSINQQQSPFNPTGAYSNGHTSGFPPHSAGGGVVSPPNQYNRQPGSFGSPYALGGRHEELMPPSSSSGGLGALARSASLGARKKDPYAYSSDDVESGLGQMDMRGEGAYAQMQQTQGYAQMARPGYNSGPGGQGGYGAVGSGAGSGGGMEVTMSSAGSSTGNRPYSTSGRSAGMAPPPIPSHPPQPPYSRPPQSNRNDSAGSSPINQHHQPYQSNIPQSHTPQSHNPYVPRSSDPGPSIQIDDEPDWDYVNNSQSRSHSNDRMPSSGSYHSQPASELRSPFLSSSETQIPSPHSPMLNPYDSSPGYTSHQMSSSPSAGQSQSGSQWGGGGGYPPSPTASTGMRPPQPPRSQSQQTYPASQPATPAGKYELGPPRGARDPRGKQPQQGFREVRDWNDLKPIGSEKANGRRADPLRPGKFLSPLQCLTSALPQTYQLCNPQFRYESSDNPRRVLTKPSKSVHNDGVDNEDWDYILYVNDVLGGDHGGDRYLILDVLGQGTFGQVVKCQNMRTHDIWAVKVVKNKPAYLNQSKMEVAILDLLNTQYDPHDQHHILRMQESFIHKNHLCLVFECLSSNLYELIKQNQFKGLSTQLVKVFTHQLLECLAVLKDARLIHCDLKPENILLKSLQSPQIKIIDFGSACHEMQTVYTYIQSRFYRSPEVLLGLPYSTSIDMWSLGCIVVELFLGLPLFPGTSEYNQLSRIVDMLGNPPGHLLDVGKQTHEFFNYAGVDTHGRKQYQLKSLEQYSQEHRTKEQPSKQYFKQTKLRDIIMEYPISKKNPRQSEVDKEMAHRRSFIDFVEGLLNLDPIKRWSPQQAAKHPFITGDKFTGPFQPPSVPSKKAYPTASVAAAVASSSAPSPATKKYGGLQSTPAPSTASSPAAATRGQRVYSDASAYNPQIATQQPQQQQQPYSAPSQQNTSRPPSFAPAYDPPPNAGHRARMPSQGQWHPMGPPQGTATYHQPRIPSSSLATSSSHGALRPNPPPTMSINTNPPPNSYYPASRNRSNTINQMDVIPPALARLTHMSMPDPSGHRNLTPVLNRGDDPYREWERRQGGGGVGGQGSGGGHSKNSSMHQTSYPQLEYLQEQAELQAMGGSWMMPGQYVGAGGTGNGGGGGQQQLGHRSRPSGSSGGMGYQMQPHIGVSPTSPGMAYHARQASEYDLPLSASSSASAAARPYLPTFPPPAATHNSSTPTFDVFDQRDPSGMGMMYAPLQPSQAYGQVGSGQQGQYGMGGGQQQQQQSQHQTRASFSGPFGIPNPFSQGNGQQSPRNQRRSQQYNV